MSEIAGGSFAAERHMTRARLEAQAARWPSPPAQIAELRRRLLAWANGELEDIFDIKSAAAAAVRALSLDVNLIYAHGPFAAAVAIFHLVDTVFDTVADEWEKNEVDEAGRWLNAAAMCSAVAHGATLTDAADAMGYGARSRSWRMAFKLLECRVGVDGALDAEAKCMTEYRARKVRA